MSGRPRIRPKALAFMALRYLALVMIAGFCVLPLLWIVKTSFETPQYIRNPRIQWVPLKPTLTNYQSVLGNPTARIGRSFLNSLKISSITTFLSVVSTSLAGYALSRFRFKGKALVSIYLLVVNMVPGTLILISMFVLLIRLNLVNTHGGIIFYYLSLGLPLATWMLKGYFDSIPIEVEEQAFVDGATRLQALRKIIVPLALPGIAAVSAYLFLVTWNEFMAASTILQRADLRTLSVQIVNFMGFQRVEWGPIMAFSVITSVPVTIAFVLSQRSMVGGLTAGFSK